MLQQKHWHVGSSYDDVNDGKFCHGVKATGVSAHLGGGGSASYQFSALEGMGRVIMAKNTDSKLHTKNTETRKCQAKKNGMPSSN